MERPPKAYTLYQTLSGNVKNTALSVANENQLIKSLDGIDDLATKTAVVKLIVEHYRLNGGKFDIKKPELPYGGIQDEDNVVFDLAKFPNELKWVLWKFMQI